MFFCTYCKLKLINLSDGLVQKDSCKDEIKKENLKTFVKLMKPFNFCDFFLNQRCKRQNFTKLNRRQ